MAYEPVSLLFASVVAIVSGAQAWGPLHASTPAWGLLAAALAASAASLLALYLWPTAFLRLLVRIVCRLRVSGTANLPGQGGALLVCHHVTHTDWLLFWAACPRPVRVIHLGATAPRGVLAWILRASNAITLDGSGGVRAVARAVRTARAALAQGELVCLLAEGRITPGGYPLAYHRIFRHLVKRALVPLIPVCLDQTWGSLFSFSGGRLTWKLPRPFRHPVRVAFGPALPSSTSAAEVRLAVENLSAHEALRHVDDILPVHRQFIRTAAAHPFRPCVFDSIRPEGLNFGRTLAGALCIGNWLRPRLGAEPMVGVWLPPSVGGVLTNIGLAILGKTSVNLNYTAGPEAIQSALRQCGVRHVITSRRFTARLKLDPGPGIEVINLEDVATQITGVQRLLAFLKVVLLPGWVLDRWVLRLGHHTSKDLATVIFSSGSTGDPKGVMLTHGNIATNAMSIIQYLAIRKHDRILGILPFFHSFGYSVTLWTPLQIGASTVYFPDPRAAQEIGALCKKYLCSIFLTTPTFLRFCLRRCETDDFRSLHLLVCGAEKMPPALAQEFRAKFGLLPLEGYGCTELSPVAAVSLPDRVIAGAGAIHNKTGSIGQPIPGVAVRVVDADRPEIELPPGREGLLLVLGPNVMKGYLDKEELTGQVVRDGWYSTGDMARIDEDGYIVLTGRLSRFAKVAGEMVPLEKVEEELHALLGTAERALCVTCVPDEARGERLIVLYTSLDGQDPRQLGRGLTTRGLPNLWVPGERDYYHVTELPILGSGKVDLQRLQKVALQFVTAGRGNGPHAPREPMARPTHATS